MRQRTLAEEGFGKQRKPAGQEQLLAEMDRVVPWRELAEVTAPHCPQPTGAGRRPVGMERMPRIHFLEHWFNLSDPAVEEALYESCSMRRFVGSDLGREPVPDESTILKSRHLLEVHELGAVLFEQVNAYLVDNGLRVATGTIVDAPILRAGKFMPCRANSTPASPNAITGGRELTWSQPVRERPELPGYVRNRKPGAVRYSRGWR